MDGPYHLEAHPVLVDREHPCPSCQGPALYVEITIVTPQLQRVAKMFGLACDCGHEEHGRLV